MSDEKNEEAGKQEETELSEDQLEEVAGGDAASPKISPYEELTGSEIYGKEIAQKVEGTGTVSEDGAEVVSDPGVGIVKSG